MKKLEVRTRINPNRPQYKQNLDTALVFLRHPEDKIEVVNGETVNITIYDNGKKIFSGCKEEFFNQLKK